MENASSIEELNRLYDQGNSLIRQQLALKLQEIDASKKMGTLTAEEADAQSRMAGLASDLERSRREQERQNQIRQINTTIMYQQNRARQAELSTLIEGSSAYNTLNATIHEHNQKMQILNALAEKNLEIRTATLAAIEAEGVAWEILNKRRQEDRLFNLGLRKNPSNLTPEEFKIWERENAGGKWKGYSKLELGAMDISNFADRHPWLGLGASTMGGPADSAARYGIEGLVKSLRYSGGQLSG